MATNTQFVDTLGGTSGLMVETMADIMSGFGAAISSMITAGRTWQARVEERKHLASLDARLLEDMGMTRADALREGNKPFWMS